ncbi:MAG: glutathione S-transferase family protein [Gammaproteobacteria bacterium]|nr:glutathione S-transferase family protein [Gammaproteobacteria bacterium]
MAFEVLGVPQSNFVRTVRIQLEEKGVEYTHTMSMPHADEVKAINPIGKVPVIRHDGFELAESLAITHYIERVFDGPALVPSDPKEAAVVEQWSALTATAIDAIMVRQYMIGYIFPRKDDNGDMIRTDIDRAVKRFPKTFAMLEGAIGSDYLGSKQFSLADCFLIPMLDGVRNFPEGKEQLSKSPGLQDYMERVSARASVTNTAPPAR